MQKMCVTILTSQYHNHTCCPFVTLKHTQHHQMGYITTLLQFFQDSASCLNDENKDLPKMFTWKVVVIRPTHCKHSVWFLLRLYKPTVPKCYRKGVIKAALVCFPFDSRRHISHARAYLLSCLIPLILIIVDRKDLTGPKCSKIGLMKGLNLNTLTCELVFECGRCACYQHRVDFSELIYMISVYSNPTGWCQSIILF